MVIVSTVIWRLPPLSVKAPVWKVRLWAAKIRKPSDTVNIGEIQIAAEDGKVVKSDLKPGRAD